MMTLARPRDLEALVRRVRTLRYDLPARWGRMTAHQMVCHACDALRMATGARATSDASSVLRRTIMKWFALYGPLRWPAGIPTTPELDQECNGTRPGDFARDLGELESLLRTVAGSHPVRWPPHPIFGPLSHRAWLRWAYLHTDHHLRQFGA
jgi:Protein of unknown function (DUF1569)